MKRGLLTLVASGGILTLLCALIPWKYCSGGNAFGLPIAIVRPSHGPLWGAIQFESTSKTHGTELSIFAFFGDVLLWSLFVAVIYYLYRSHLSSAKKEGVTPLRKK